MGEYFYTYAKDIKVEHGMDGWFVIDRALLKKYPAASEEEAVQLAQELRRKKTKKGRK